MNKTSVRSFLCLVLILGFSSALPGQQGAVLDASLETLSLPETDEGLEGSGPVRHYDWFKNVWQRRQKDFAAARQNDAIIFLGDSITQGWGDDFGGVFGDTKVVNRGISGDTTRGMLYRLEHDVIDIDPAAVVILAGTNDLEENAQPETIASNMRLMIEKLQNSDSDMPIVLCLVFPSDESKKRPTSKIKKLNELYRQIARSVQNVTLLDTWTLFANKDGNAKAEEFPDLLHPNQTGYKKWEASIRPVLATLGFLDTDNISFKLEPGFDSLFNGVDLTGWGYRPTSKKMLRGRERWQKSNPAAPPWPIVTEAVSFDSLKRSPDGRYVAIAGRLVVTIPREGRRIQQLWTSRQFDSDFELRLEFRATPNADSGIFIREPQLQCRDFGLAGPYKDLKSYKPQEWNDVTIVVKGNVATYTCNGEVLEESVEVPDTGPIGLEGDRGQIEYRNIRLKIL